MKSGFSILEVMTIMSISAILMTGIFQVYRLVQKNAVKVEQYSEQGMKVVTLQNRLQQDFLGFGAVWFTQDAAQKQKLLQGKSVDVPVEKKNKFFYADQKNNQFNMCSFVTTASLSMFDGLKPRFVRVIYEMRQDSKHKGLWEFVRKEVVDLSENINEQQVEKAKSYVVADGVKSLQFDYQFIDVVAVRKKAKGQKVEKEIIRSVQNWSPPKDDEDQSDVGGADGPRVVKLKIVFGGIEGKQIEREYEMSFYIPSSIDLIPKSYLEARKERKFKAQNYKNNSKPAKTNQPTPQKKK